METIQFINNLFWKESGYFLLLVVCLYYLWRTRKNDVRGFRLMVYSVIVLIFVIWNPIVAKYGVVFFGEDMYAYLRIFYLLPLMTVIAYAMTKFGISVEKNQGRKSVWIVLILLIILSGQLYGKSMYQGVTNLYKIDQDALDISDCIKEDSNNQRVYAVVPQKEEIYYGIRQYAGNITIVGTMEKLDEIETNQFEYLVLEQNFDTDISLQDFSQIGQTEHYMVYKRMEM